MMMMTLAVILCAALMFVIASVALQVDECTRQRARTRKADLFQIQIQKIIFCSTPFFVASYLPRPQPLNNKI